jgi:leucyl/phenylalanyl-tRNA--protein transferase
MPRSPESRGRLLPPEQLLAAYAQGAFPMASGRAGRIEWYTADPRALLPFRPLHVPRRLRRSLARRGFSYTRDQRFAEVIAACARREETWISDVLRESYIRLHELGHAHSVETWLDGVLVGGLYGVALGGAFFGESMFHREDDASKGALVHLAEHLEARGFELLEIQMVTPLTAQFQPILVRAAEYLQLLRKALAAPCRW